VADIAKLNWISYISQLLSISYYVTYIDSKKQLTIKLYFLLVGSYPTGADAINISGLLV